MNILKSFEKNAYRLPVTFIQVVEATYFLVVLSPELEMEGRDVFRLWVQKEGVSSLTNKTKSFKRAKNIDISLMIKQTNLRNRNGGIDEDMGEEVE